MNCTKCGKPQGLGTTGNYCSQSCRDDLTFRIACDSPKDVENLNNVLVVVADRDGTVEEALRIAKKAGGRCIESYGYVISGKIVKSFIRNDGVKVNVREFFTSTGSVYTWELDKPI